MKVRLNLGMVFDRKFADLYPLFPVMRTRHTIDLNYQHNRRNFEMQPDPWATHRYRVSKGHPNQLHHSDPHPVIYSPDAKAGILHYPGSKSPKPSGVELDHFFALYPALFCIARED